MQLAIISDTHLPRGARRLPAACLARLAAADAIVHAGDFIRAEVIASLRLLGPPVVAVHGNVDDPALQAELPEVAVIEAGGAWIAVIHDAGPARGRVQRMRTRFPDADAVVFGHSHLPLLERDSGGFQIFNPGSPTERRRAPHHTMGVADAREGRVTFELVDLG